MQKISIGSTCKTADKTTKENKDGFLTTGPGAGNTGFNMRSMYYTKEKEVSY